MLAKNKMENNQSKFTEDWLPIKKINNGLIYIDGKLLDGKQVVTGVKIEPKNIFISDEQVQNYTIDAIRNLYNVIDYEFWVLCCDRPVDINLYRSELEVLYNRETNPNIRKLIIQDIAKCEKFVGPEINAVDTEFYLLFKENEKNTDAISKKIHNLISGLAAGGLNSRQLSDEDARALLDSFFNDSKKYEFGTVMSDV